MAKLIKVKYTSIFLMNPHIETVRFKDMKELDKFGIRNPDAYIESVQIKKKKVKRIDVHIRKIYADDSSWYGFEYIYSKNTTKKEMYKNMLKYDSMETYSGKTITRRKNKITIKFRRDI